MQLDAEHLGAFIGYGTDIDILSKATPLHQLHSEPAKLINGVRELDLEQLATLAQSLIVLLESEEVYLLLIAIPVPSNSLKASGAVVKGMGHDANLGLGQRQELLLKKGIGRHFKTSVLRLGLSIISPDGNGKPLPNGAVCSINLM
jgi:hypothetical protein